MAGGRARVALMPSAARAALRRHAAFLRDQGQTFSSTAERIEASVTEGFVYVIAHPSWPNAVKVGCAIDMASRLLSFQTGCPARAYRIEQAIYTSDRRRSEAAIHAYLAPFRLQGEWFALKPAEVRQVLERHEEFDPSVFGEAA